MTSDKFLEEFTSIFGKNQLDSNLLRRKTWIGKDLQFFF
jgi:hypothetical protein